MLSAVLGVVILSVRPSVRPSVRHTRALWLIQRTYRRYFIPRERAILVKRDFFVQLCSSWQDFNWLKGSRGLSAAAELLYVCTTRCCADIRQSSDRFTAKCTAPSLSFSRIVFIRNANRKSFAMYKTSTLPITLSNQRISFQSQAARPWPIPRNTLRIACHVRSYWWIVTVCLITSYYFAQLLTQYIICTYVHALHC